MVDAGHIHSRLLAGHLDRNDEHRPDYGRIGSELIKHYAGLVVIAGYTSAALGETLRAEILQCCVSLQPGGWLCCTRGIKLPQAVGSKFGQDAN
jgi:hypothetical protein